MTPPARSGRTGPAENRVLYAVDDVRTHRRGGLGVVYEARLEAERFGTAAGSPVGLKMLTGIDQERFAKLAGRSAALRAVRHPHLAGHVECFIGPPPVDGPVDEDECDQFFSVHEWIEGQPLRERIPDASVPQVLAWGRQIAEAVDFLHAYPGGGFAHRDIHPRNVIVGPDDQAVLIDYDTILWGDVADTRLVSMSGLGSAISSPGLAGAQAQDRAMLATTLLRALAGDADAELGPEALRERAVDRLAGTAMDPAGVVRVLVDAVDTPPASAAGLVDALARPMEHPDRAERLRSLTPWTWVGFGSAAVILLGLGLAVALQPHTPALTSATHHSGSPAGSTASPTTGGPAGASGPATGTGPATTTARTNGSAAGAPGSGLSSSPVSTTHAAAGSTRPRSTTPATHHSSTSSATHPAVQATFAETTGGGANTWTDYTNAGGTAGPGIPGHASVQISCALHGFQVANGNTWWYRIASSPWNNAYYVSADVFYNNGQISGSLSGTPFVDPAVPHC